MDSPSLSIATTAPTQSSNQFDDTISCKHLHVILHGPCQHLYMISPDDVCCEEAEKWVLQLLQALSFHIHRWCGKYLKTIKLSCSDNMQNEMHLLATLDIPKGHSINKKKPPSIPIDIGKDSLFIDITRPSERYKKNRFPDVEWLKEHNNKYYEFRYEVPKTSDKAQNIGSWVQLERTGSNNRLNMVMEAQGPTELKQVLFENYTPEELEKTGPNLVRLKEALTIFTPDPTEVPAEFPRWTQRKIDKILVDHPVVSKTVLTGESCLGITDCPACHEYQFSSLLRWWYYDVFMQRDKKVMMINNDETTSEDIGRLKTLVVRGRRESGKTKWFQNCCKRLKHRICHFKNRITKESCVNIDTAWLILLDDYKYKPEDEEMVKAFLAGEPTSVLGKWLAKEYGGGVPCVILCNSEKFYSELRENPDFSSQCKFIDLDESYIGPPGSEDTKKVKNDGLHKAEKPSQKKKYDQMKEEPAKGRKIKLDDGPITKKLKQENQAYKLAHSNLLEEHNNLKTAYKSLETTVWKLNSDIKKLKECYDPTDQFISYDSPKQLFTQCHQVLSESCDRVIDKDIKMAIYSQSTRDSSSTIFNM